jgi:hypothetical protein
MLGEIQKLAIEASLKKMVREKYFNICVIDSINKVTNNIPDAESYHTLKLLHCVDYSEMSKDLIAALPGLIRASLGGPKIDLSESFFEPQCGQSNLQVVKSTNNDGFLRWLRLKY